MNKLNGKNTKQVNEGMYVNVDAFIYYSTYYVLSSYGKL